MRVHPAALGDEELMALCDWGRGRASGPGGQHRNKVETAVFVTHKATGVRAQASERRSQIENKRVALRRLRLELATRVREPAERAAGLDGEVASELWRGRRKGERIACNPEHRDYAALLAEALDVIADSGWDAVTAARRLGVTTSQLIKLVKGHAPAFQLWNTERSRLGMKGLK